jgi:hypothetical protein
VGEFEAECVAGAHDRPGRLPSSSVATRPRSTALRSRRE